MTYCFDSQEAFYLQFLCEQLLQLLDDIPLAAQQTVWVLHDGHLPIFFTMVCDIYIATALVDGQDEMDLLRDLRNHVTSLLSTSICGAI
jgi:hypothetical protein